MAMLPMSRLTKADSDNWFEATWADREDQIYIYPQLFGSVGNNISPVSAQLFTDTFQQDFNPPWLHCGVFESQPNQQHDSCLYVTSGQSNGWEDAPRSKLNLRLGLRTRLRNDVARALGYSTRPTHHGCSAAWL